MRAKKAFTLVELLVVISIIAILLAVLVPALSKAREQGRMVVCRTNEKGLSLAAALWSNDHDNWVIPGAWFMPYKNPDTGAVQDWSLEKYCGANGKKGGGILVCPTAASGGVKFFASDSHFDTYGNERKYTYAANAWMTMNMHAYNEGSPGTMGPSPAEYGRGSVSGYERLYGLDKKTYWTVHGVTKMDSIRMSSETAYFMDNEYYAVICWYFSQTKTLQQFKDGGSPIYASSWHNFRGDPMQKYGTNNIGWVDGHASTEPKDFKSKDTVTKTVPGATGPVTVARWEYYFWNH
jgi:prepilin-type N-terminal cleavage/methylation domain-containing protein/prepilin-type processing-associated H-X9-DG protein